MILTQAPGTNTTFVRLRFIEHRQLRRVCLIEIGLDSNGTRLFSVLSIRRQKSYGFLSSQRYYKFRIRKLNHLMMRSWNQNEIFKWKKKLCQSKRYVVYCNARQCRIWHLVVRWRASLWEMERCIFHIGAMACQGIMFSISQNFIATAHRRSAKREQMLKLTHTHQSKVEQQPIQRRKFEANMRIDKNLCLTSNTFPVQE